MGLVMEAKQVLLNLCINKPIQDILIEEAPHDVAEALHHNKASPVTNKRNVS